ncbi:GTPase and tRNA-U34 5-formylation enzyme TrmE [Candidatus Karelsulcia muelleri]|uniref:tRNA modification GTPase MnmE n=1 Tax=Candidatus Karelsulcia muelleri TaxID=336810 RepID=A0A654M5H6_9FLAO|nr:tRNA uridine-5-carboxymethylaminomethyl(34) synthesis GTPase MnmE [Candidatus Karelsulcia muelleri]AGS33362.1 GTPase and tRNA-U34 5-formylation enzyme TrmE [Candidatus Karelsulcia muelleri str. Sulcia-ALF]ALP70102.1 GTPase and tRNA-U34 5-formylation enzyme TrmE [Candidatus Karelsulcia muelleri]QND78348.1 tRNA modification GTPase MnmE [Candidatus Karelsulcia muelleri]
MLKNDDTIVAIATPSGYGAIAVIRISGNNSIKIIKKIFDSFSKNKIEKNSIQLGYIKYKNQLIDKVLIFLFKKPKSYTGEDIVEISCHGSIYIQNKLLSIILDQGARLANPGEFTLRAFLNGKIDLCQAESILDIVNSETFFSHKFAINQIRGNISILIRKLRKKIINLLSLIEFELDFSEENCNFINYLEFKKMLYNIIKKLKTLIRSFKIGNALKNGISVSIIGCPNVGKSTLFNKLLKYERSIVSNIAGTTRNYIEDSLIINGIKFRFIDTAGINNNTKDYIEKLGIKKTYSKIKKSDLILYVFDDFNEKFIFKKVKSLQEKYPKKKIFIIINKYDLIKKKIKPINYKKIFKISAKYGYGVNNLLSEITFFSKKITSLKERTIVITQTRHYESFKKAIFYLYKVKKNLSSISPEFLSIDIRTALDYLGKVTGEVTNEDILSNIFSKFCIGK